MKNVILSLSLFIILCGNVFADTLYLRNGTQFTGRVVRQDAEKVVFRIGTDADGMDVTFFSDEVLRVDKAEVSSFITLPMGQGKQINIPRPIFAREPMLSEKARVQSEKRQKAEEGEQAQAKPEESSAANTAQQEGSQPDALSKIAGSESLSKAKDITEELMPLLDKEEKDYLSKINSMAKAPTDGAMRILSDHSALTGNSDKLPQLLGDIPSQMDDIIKQLNILQPPQAFVNFQKKYLEDITSIKDAFLDLSKGDVVNSQSKIEKLQTLSSELQEELSRILSEKKKKSL